MTPRILVVDDEELWRDILKSFLEDNLSYHVDTAASLQEALDFLRNQQPYHVVITDIGLTKKETNTDGIEVLKAVHKYSPTTQTIAVSGRAAIANQEQFKATYHTLEYFEREVLSNDMESFIDSVTHGVDLSLKQ